MNHSIAVGDVGRGKGESGRNDRMGSEKGKYDRLEDGYRERLPALSRTIWLTEQTGQYRPYLPGFS